MFSSVEYTNVLVTNKVYEFGMENQSDFFGGASTVPTLVVGGGGVFQLSRTENFSF